MGFLKGIGCLVVLAFLGMMMVFKVLRGIFTTLTGEVPAQRKKQQARRSHGNAHTVKHDAPKKKKKVIADDEGEYVDFEDSNKR